MSFRLCLSKRLRRSTSDDFAEKKDQIMTGQDFLMVPDPCTAMKEAEGVLNRVPILSKEYFENSVLFREPDLRATVMAESKIGRRRQSC